MNSFGIFHEMGLGKTLTALSLLGRLYDEGDCQTALIVCPASVTGVWVREADKFCTYPLRVVPLTGSVVKRAAKLQATIATPFDGLTMLVTNYEVLWRDQILAGLTRADIDVMICDEAHRLKSASAKQSIAARKIGANAIRIALTGTPVANTLTDWFGIYRWMDPTVFGTSFTAFRDRYFDVFALDHGAAIIRGVKPWMQDELDRKAHSLAHACSKEQALDLPDQIDTERTCELEPKARRAYEDMKRDAVAYLAELDGDAVVGSNALTRVLRLSQITGGFVRGEDGKVAQVSDAKMKLLRETLSDILRQQDRVVIFARFTPELDAIVKVCHDLGVTPHEIRGGVSAQQRTDAIEAFQSDNPDQSVIVAQWQAGGTGITLHSACEMILYSLPSSLGDWLQARDRIHRIGQNRCCTYTSLIATGTLDHKLLERLIEKREVANASVHQWRQILN